MVPLTIDTFARQLRAGETSSSQAVEDCLRRIDADNPRLNAFIQILAEDARRQAAEADRELASGIDRGPLHGVPVSVKDVFDIAGTVTTAASRVRESIVASRDALAVTRLRRAGAVIVGKTNLHEFAFGTTNEDSAFGPARNPIDDTRSPGGSSGGSAASVVAGMALATVGTDTGGSIRIPAAACGLVGLKPGYDELPADGVVPLSRTLDHVGPLTATVSDGWHMLHALRDRAPAKPLSVTPVRSLTLGVPRQYFCDVLDEDVRRAFETALGRLRGEGATITAVDIPHASLIAPIYLHIVFGDAAAYHGDALDTMPDKYTPNVRLRLEMARYVTAEDYVRALDGRRVLRREVDSCLSGVDALVLPTLPIVAPPIGAGTVQVGERHEPVRNLMLRLTQLFNLTGHPAITLPCGASASGLPCGLQLVGVTGQTDNLLHVAAGVELSLRW
ncbi:MAG: amidase [Vicinamibacterales bacterium]